MNKIISSKYLSDLIQLYFLEEEIIELGKVKKKIIELEGITKKYSSFIIPYWAKKDEREILKNGFILIKENEYLFSSHKKSFTYREYYKLLEFEKILSNFTPVYERIIKILFRKKLAIKTIATSLIMIIIILFSIHFYDSIKYFVQIGYTKLSINLNPGESNKYKKLGNLYYHVNRYDKAIKVYKKAIELKPEYSIAYNNLGAAYTKLKRYDDAIKVYKKAIEINPDYSIAYYNLGIIYTTLKLYDEAIAANAKAENIKPRIDIAWERTFGGRMYECAQSLVQTRDGGYLIGGYSCTDKSEYKKPDFWIIKLDNRGNKEWDKTFGGGLEDKLFSIIQTIDDGYVLAGYNSSKKVDNEDIWIIKLDNKGNKLWDRVFDEGDDEKAFSIIQTIDKGYAIAGSTYSKGAGKSDFLVMKIDNQGNKIWDRTFGGNGYDWGQSVIQTNDTGIVVAGYRTKDKCPYIWVVKLDNNGNEIWDKYIEMVGKEGENSFVSGDFDKRLSLVQTHDSGYAIVGYSLLYGSPFIKLDNKGNIVWKRYLEGTGYSLVQNHNDYYMIAGNTRVSSGDRLTDIWVMLSDDNGNKIWDRTFGGTSYDYAYSIIQIEDGGYAVAGEIHGNFRIIKLNREQILE